MGCEMEGGFRYPLGYPIYGEGVDVPEGEMCINGEELEVRVGEVQSKPFFRKDLLKHWVKRYFPVITNDDCGFHIHVSFKQDNWHDALANEKFNNDFLRDLKRWLKNKKVSKAFQARLDDENDYCRHEFEGFERGAVHCHSEHGTIEFRIFSMVITPKLAQQCVDWTFNYVERYLHKLLKNGNS